MVHDVQRYPEKVFWYKAEMQNNRVILPVDICSNKNGVIFILYAGAACVHVIDRSVIANARVVGTYMGPCLSAYTSKNILSGIRFSNHLGDITIDDEDNIYISDSGRHEIVIIYKFTGDKPTGLFYTLKVDAMSIVYTDNLMLLKRIGTDKVMQKLSFTVPSKAGPSKNFNLKFTVLMNVVLSTEVSLKKLFYIPLAKYVGAFGEDYNLVMIKLQSKNSFAITKLRSRWPNVFIPNVHYTETNYSL